MPARAVVFNVIHAERSFSQPPRTHRDDGGERRVGFELEFTGLTIEQTAQAARDTLGGELRHDSLAEWKLAVDGLGEFAIELDWDYLKRRAAESDGSDDAGEWLLSALKSAAALVVPLEIVCPPMPLSRLDLLDALVERLRDEGGVGTGDSVLAAYGVHINAEAPSMETVTLARYAKAFALLQWWLVKAHEVDLSRRITPYIDPWPQAYVAELLAMPEHDTDAFIGGYLAHNASRNRALDLLPLLCELDEPRVRAAVDDARIKARPAFHYRLPNCHLARDGWTLAAPWSLWVVVERLADDADGLAELSAMYLDQLRPVLGANRRAWTDAVDTWLTERGLA